MGRLTTWGLLALTLGAVVAGPVLAQDPEQTIQDTLAPILDPVAEQGVGGLEEGTGEDFTSEEISISLNLDVFNVELQLINMLFGGGKIQADVDAGVILEFRAVSATRLDEMIRQASGDANRSLQDYGVPANRTAVTAEEIRLAGGGALLEVFQSMQAEATKRLIEDTVPGMVVQSASFDWRNTQPLRWVVPPNGTQGAAADPLAAAPRPEQREPPLTLDASFRLQYLDRTSMFALVVDDEPQDEENKTREEELKASIAENETLDVMDRNAFGVLGYGQLLAFGVPPGWRVALNMTVPDGFTLESVTDELSMSPDHRTASFILDGSDRAEVAQRAAIATISSRFLVVTTLLGALLVVGMFLRVPLESVIIGGTYWRARRYGEAWRRRPWRERAARRLRDWSRSVCKLLPASKARKGVRSDEESGGGQE